MQLPHTFATRAALLASGIVGLSVAAPAQSLVETSSTIVAASTDPVPDSTGTPIPNLTFGNTLDDCVLDASGKVFFRGQLVDSMTPVTGINDRAYFQGSSRATLRMVVRGGDQAPGMLPGVLLRSTTGSSSSLSSITRVTSDGRMLWGTLIYDAGVTVTSADDDCLFGGPFGSQALIVRQNDVAPGTGGATFAQAFSSPTLTTMGMNEGGVVYFQGTLTGATAVPPVSTVNGSNNQTGVWTGIPGNLELVVRKNDPVAGLGGEVATNLTSPALASFLQINDSGKLLFDVNLSTTAGTPAATALTDKVLMVHTQGGGNQLIVRESDPAPGTVGATFNSVSTANSWVPSVSQNVWLDSDEVAFLSELRGGDVVGTTNDVGLFRGGVGTLALVARKGEVVPGTGGATIGAFSFTRVFHNTSGLVAFQATLAGAGTTTINDGAIVAGPAGNLQVVARENDVMPGTGGGTLSTFSLATIHVNNLGQVLFTCSLTGGTNPGNSWWLWDAVNGLRAVGLNGDQLEVAPAVFKTMVSYASVQDNNGDGSSMSLSHDGTIALRANMNDSSRAIVIIKTSPPPVPYCFGDGTGSFCPCSPAPVPHGAAGKGCPTNIFAGGALATAAGTSSLANDTLVLTGTDMINGSMIFYQGALVQSGGMGAVFGDGLRCIQPTGIRRFQVKTVVGNTASYPQLGDNAISVAGLVMAPGTRNYQGWYRSANPTFCTADTFNLTNGLTITWTP